MIWSRARLFLERSTAARREYIAPEQGRQGGHVDGRTDIVFAGRRPLPVRDGRLPFNAETAVALIDEAHGASPAQPATRVPDLPPQVDYVIRRAMEKDPERRYQRAADMAADLRALGEELRLTGRVAVPSVPGDHPRSPLPPLPAPIPPVAPASVTVAGSVTIVSIATARAAATT